MLLFWNFVEPNEPNQSKISKVNHFWDLEYPFYWFQGNFGRITAHQSRSYWFILPGLWPIFQPKIILFLIHFVGHFGRLSIHSLFLSIKLICAYIIKPFWGLRPQKEFPNWLVKQNFRNIDDIFHSTIFCGVFFLLLSSTWFQMIVMRAHVFLLSVSLSTLQAKFHNQKHDVVRRFSSSSNN